MNQLRAEIIDLGLKVTPQRMAILEFLRGNSTHPAAENIHHQLLSKYPSISLTTIYSTLSKLVEKQKVKELDIDPEKKRFDVCLKPHDHFFCRVCGNVYDVFCDALNSADNSKIRKDKDIDGHHVDVIGINLKGVCKYCEATLA